MSVVTPGLECRVCRSRNVSVRALLQPDHGTERYRAISCADCGVVFSDPMPDLSFQSIQDFYGSDYIDDQSAMSERGESLEIVRCATAKQMDIVERYVRPGVALNVGATNESVRVIAERGWTLRLVEASAYSAEQARAEWGFDVVTSRIEDYECAPASLDFVKLGHVIEHLANPEAVLRRLASMLRPGGVLLVDTDNARGLSSRIEISVRDLLGEDRSAALVWRLTGKNFRKRYGTLGPPLHLYAFTRKSLTRLLVECGYEVVRTWQPAHGDSTWYPITRGMRISRAERAMLELSRVGAWFGAGDVVAVLARKP